MENFIVEMNERWHKNMKRKPCIRFKRKTVKTKSQSKKDIKV